MPKTVDDCPFVTAPESADAKRRRRKTMTTLVQALVHLADGGRDTGGLKHRAAIAQATAIIGSMTGTIAQADDKTFVAIVTEAASLAKNLQQRAVAMARATLH